MIPAFLWLKNKRGEITLQTAKLINNLEFKEGIHKRFVCPDNVVFTLKKIVILYFQFHILMPDSRTYFLRKLAKLPFSYARKTRTGLFISSILFALLLTYLSGDVSFTPTQNQVLFLLFFAIGLWLTEAIPPFAVGILIVGFMVFIMGREDQVNAYKYVQTWSDGVIWLFLGGFFLAEGMKKTRLDMSVLKRVAPKFGTQTKYIALGFMMVTAVLSMVMSNTATTGMMLATLAPLIKSRGRTRAQRVFLLGIPASAALGGMGTIIGSAPNAIAVGALESVGIKVSFIEWMAIGMPVALILTYLFWVLLIKKFGLENEQTDLEFLKTLNTDEKHPDDRAQKNITLVIMGLTIFLWLTSQWTMIPVAAVSGIPIVGLTMLGVIDADDVRSLPWDTLMLVAGGLALGMAVQEQGLIDYFVEKISHYELNYYVLLVVFSFVTVTISNFMSNTAATTILLPVAISLMSISGNSHPVILPLAIGLSASCALLLPVSTPPNAIAYSTGLLEQKDFRFGGYFIGGLGPVVIILWSLLVGQMIF